MNIPTDELLQSKNMWSAQRTVERNKFIIQPGEIERNIYFVEDGALRVFFVTEFEENTIRFGYKNSFITSLPSFLTSNLPSFISRRFAKANYALWENNTFYPSFKKNLPDKNNTINFSTI